MKSNRTISVTAWTQSRDAIVPEKGIRRASLPPALIGFIGSLLLLYPVDMGIYTGKR